MDEFDDIITLKNEAGEDVSFVFLDLIEYQGNKYVVLLPSYAFDDELEEVVILMAESTDDPDQESYIGVEDQNTLDAVFELFREKIQDGYDFTD